MKLSNDIQYVGVSDRELDLFESQYRVPNGMSYNSYVILDEKIAVMDTVEAHFTRQWLEQLAAVLAGRRPDYLIVQHMEPDHSSSIGKFLEAYPDTTVVSNAKSFAMMENFYGAQPEKTLPVDNGSQLCLGRHTLHFLTAPMVHWPEVIMTYDAAERTLFSADAFGKFGTAETDEPWDDEARRYYIGIVGKYGMQVQAVLKKAKALDIERICPLHGPVLNSDLEHYLELYQTWSSYGVESPGVLICYTSVYGNTRKAVELLEQKLRQQGCGQVVVHDLARTEMSLAVADAFRYGKVVLATTTYNMGVFPYMRTFLGHLTERNFQNRTVGLIENGTWAPQAANVMKQTLSACKNLTWTDTTVHIKSGLSQESMAQIDALAAELCR